MTRIRRIFTDILTIMSWSPWTKCEQ